MSVMVIEEKQYVELASFLAAEGKTYEESKKIVQSLYNLNIKNYNKRYDDHCETELLDFKQYVPLIAPEEALRIIESIHYNLIDYGKQIDVETLDLSNEIIEYIKKEYSNYMTARRKKFTLYGDKDLY
ncbi:hypothetical protein MKY91_20320 [Alkalicoccobacillus gibsonii]|uniref:Uncharacterized protein n=1 Tax=Alkalicoccobacillus gibsonii TaxID=79881 RepID=A0ABU9VQR4_9BACI